jgi:hypothetical protein
VAQDKVPEPKSLFRQRFGVEYLWVVWASANEEHNVPVAIALATPVDETKL